MLRCGRRRRFGEAVDDVVDATRCWGRCRRDGALDDDVVEGKHKGTVTKVCQFFPGVSSALVLSGVMYTALLTVIFSGCCCSSSSSTSSPRCQKVGEEVTLVFLFLRRESPICSGWNNV